MGPLADEAIITVDDLANAPHNAEGLVEITIEGEGTAPPAKAKPEGKFEPLTQKSSKVASTEADLAATRQELEAEKQARAQLHQNAVAALQVERKARIEAQAEATKNIEVGMRAHWEKINAVHDHIAGSLSSHERELENASAALTAAQEAQDYSKVTQLTGYIADIKGAIGTLKAGKHQADADIKEAERAFGSYKPPKVEDPKVPAAQSQQRQQPAPPKTAEDFIHKSGFPEATVEWLEANKDYVTDKSKFGELQGFASKWAKRYGPQSLHTPPFIEALNKQFAKEETQEEEPVVAEAEPTRQPEPRHTTTSAAAPVSRGTSPANPSASLGSIKLTRPQYEEAPKIYETFEDLDPDLQQRFGRWSESAARVQYDRHLKRAQAEGKFR